MSLPRQVLANQTYLLTRRCMGRRFLLRPDKRLNNLFVYCLALAAQKYGIQIHAFCVMSNHYHLVLTDTEGVGDSKFKRGSWDIEEMTYCTFYEVRMAMGCNWAPKEPERGQHWRVRVGPFTNRQKAIAYKAKFEKSEGISAYIVHNR